MTVCRRGVGAFSRKPGSYNTETMPVTVEMHNTGDSKGDTEILVVIEHLLSDRPGDWRVFIVGPRADDNWEMRVEGPKGFERSYTLVGTAGEREPEAIRTALLKLLPGNTPGFAASGESKLTLRTSGK
jgi:hypothetical protein